MYNKCSCFGRVKAAMGHCIKYHQREAIQYVTDLKHVTLIEQCNFNTHAVFCCNSSCSGTRTSFRFG